ncbi:NUDIX hydrolase [Propionibacterium australiense]|uniref:Histidine phosphatase superfamily, clade-1 n=1 Tax=Propionibacterium australiense TaxID=119981 RepID=A0A383S7M8_9ACTN|nr:NUDIX domain-containing protein [Propionibacterium australiense]RLP09017.1 NUDIX domain-containing protein [Propionibacterium australiense]RLP09049.1 NUDIX domain-containing protein [Propionibacterium australiense]SYZ33414.1 Histidine phosphatase superfamily, clade-1 [Propionibacterium australiense]VEH91893.1 Predicted NTP pyrophosphohydrolase [Propionibacterium australiense]
MTSGALKGEPRIWAAGAVVLRVRGGRIQVLIEHVPRYGTWGLPKGHQEQDEQLPVTAAREVAEETGVRVRLTRPLPPLDYLVGPDHKRVHWWLGVAVDETPSLRDDEADEVLWATVGEADALLAHADERALLARAVEIHRQGPTGVLVLTRHAKASPRKAWKGDDWLRPLAPRGERQSARLPALFSAYGVNRVVSSTSTRCVQTVEPYAEETGTAPELIALLSEEVADGNDEQVSAYMAELRMAAGADPGVRALVCGHRPVLPAMQAGLDLDRTPMHPGQSLVLHIGPDGQVLDTESHLAVG